MANHTPGPWLLIDNLNSITVCSNRANEDGFYLDADIASNGDCSRADARLIAAAPDLLDVATEAHRIMSHLIEHDSLPPDTCPADLFDIAAAAIRKAKGG